MSTLHIGEVIDRPSTRSHDHHLSETFERRMNAFQQKLKDEEDRIGTLALKVDVDAAVRAEREANDWVKAMELEILNKRTSREESLRKLEEEIRVLKLRLRGERWIHSEEMETEMHIVNDAKKRAEEAREERVNAERQLQEHPHTQSLKYSRKCPVCLSSNPSRRSVMVACGHMVCTLCADELQKTSASNASTTTVSCPLCRKDTTYVTIFEDLQTPKVRQAEAPETRKCDAEVRSEVISPPRPVPRVPRARPPVPSHSWHSQRPSTPQDRAFQERPALINSRTTQDGERRTPRPSYSSSSSDGVYNEDRYDV